MKVFIAGATGAVGRPLVSACIAAGHSVIGLARTASKADVLRRMGAEPVIADGLDAGGIGAALVTMSTAEVIQDRQTLPGALVFRNFFSGLFYGLGREMFEHSFIEQTRGRGARWKGGGGGWWSLMGRPPVATPVPR